MVARNFLIQDHLPYSRLLQVPDEEREFLTLDELKPHQLTELGGLNRNTEVSVSKSQLTVPVFSTASNSNQSSNNQQIYYDLNTQQTTNANNSSSLTNPYHYLNDPPPDKGSTSYDQNSLCLDINTAGSSSNSFQSLMQSGYQDHQSSEMIQHLQNPPMNQLQSSVPLIHQDQNCFQEKKSIKRKLSFTENSDVDDDDPGDDAKSVRTTDDNKKQNHSEIEKRRRDKMNFYITELSSIVPVCHSMSRKLDKLTVLRMAVQHLKTIRGAVHSYTEGHYKPAFLSDQELKMLILQAAEGFLFVVSCDRGRILYVSESVSQVLNYSQGDLLGQSWFDIIHQKDVAKVKEQLSSLDLNTRDRLIDAKTMLPVKTDIPHGLSRLCPGARRSFLCRMKCKNFTHIKEEVEPNGTSNQTSGSQSGKENHKRKSKMNADKRYCVIQCTGYLKSWAPAKIGLDEQETDGEGDAVNLSCLVAVGRIPPNVFTPTNLPNSSQNSNLRIIQFFSRHATDGRFLFVDQRATLVLGFLPQELLTTSMYEYYHPDDIPKLIEAHKTTLQGTEKVTTEIYRLRIKDGNFIKVQSEWKSFRNPWTKEIDYVIAKNSVILNETKVTVPEEGMNMDLNSRPIIANSRQSTGRDTPSQGHFEFFNQGNVGRPLRIVNTHIEASAIGRQVAEQALEYHRRYGENLSDSSPDPEREQGSNNSSNYHPSNHLMASMASESMTTNSISNSHHSTSGNPTEMSSIADQAPLHPHPRRINGTLPGYNLIRSDHSSQSNSNSSIDGGSNSEQSAGNQDSIHIQNASMGQDGQNQANDGNDEAAMAVIMSLLEADAGLGGPVDFTGLPWPLP